MGGSVVDALIAGAGTVALVSMVKFLRLLDMQPAEGRKDEDNNNKWEQEQEPEDHWMADPRLMLCL